MMAIHITGDSPGRLHAATWHHGPEWRSKCGRVLIAYDRQADGWFTAPKWTWETGHVPQPARVTTFAGAPADIPVCKLCLCRARTELAEIEARVAP